MTTIPHDLAASLSDRAPRREMVEWREHVTVEQYAGLNNAPAERGKIEVGAPGHA